MALQVYAATPRSTMMQSTAWQGIITRQQPAMVSVATDCSSFRLIQGKQRSISVKCSMDAVAAAEAVAEVGCVTEVNMDTFWPIVKNAGDKTVVVDMYTQWCGPCKMMAPKFEQLSKNYSDVVFLKLDCNQENRPLAKELGIKVVPTFKILKDSKIVKEVTGAKFDDLVAAIDTARTAV